MEQKKSPPKYTAEFRARGVRLFKDHRADYGSDNAAYKAIAAKLSCSPDSVRAWCQRAERDAGERAGLTSDEKARLKALERENQELRQANEILKKASAYFAMAELDWSAPIGWSSLNISAWWASGLSASCFQAPVGDSPTRCGS